MIIALINQNGKVFCYKNEQLNNFTKFPAKTGRKSF